MTSKTFLNTISHTDYLNMENDWGLYRSFRTAQARDWYADRLPDEELRVFAIVQHPTRFIIATRSQYPHDY